jgi:hypothetical protein
VIINPIHSQKIAGVVNGVKHNLHSTMMLEKRKYKPGKTSRAGVLLSVL